MKERWGDLVSRTCLAGIRRATNHSEKNSIPAIQFFFLWYGRSRSKARSLHEKKLLSRKFQHGHWWSHDIWQIIRNQTTKHQNKRQDADPPARFASHHREDSKANSQRGKGPTKTTTQEICQGHSGKNPLCRI